MTGALSSKIVHNWQAGHPTKIVWAVPARCRARTFAEKGAKGKGLSSSPVDALATLDHLAPLLVHSLHSLVQREVLGNFGDCIADLTQRSHTSANTFS